jgi:anthranilate phosphoribosyltransferase
MNAAAALLAGDRVDTLQQGVALAGEVIDSGHALAKLERLIEFSQSLTGA